jgi:regulator of RNase E activity RraA
MSDKKDKNIKKNSKKISQDLVERVGKLSTSLISDGMENSRTMNYRIKPIKGGMKILGTALTVKVKPGDNLYLHKAIYKAEEGYVLVMENGENQEAAVWGEMMSRGALAVGLSGVVLEGFVRDLADIKELGLPIFATGALPKGPTVDGPGSINTEITCGGVKVCPGDLVFGDDDGVVVVAPEELEDVVKKAEAKLLREGERIKELEDGKLVPDWVNK